jgi:virginiamycin B lyase
VSLNPSKFLIFLLASVAIAETQGSNGASKPGIKEVQVPYSSIKPTATIKIGGTADWVLVAQDAVWVSSTKPFAVLRIDPATNTIVANIRIPGQACSGLASGFGSIWAPICGKNPALVRIDAAKNSITATLPISPAGEEGGIATGTDSVWLVTDNNGTLLRIDPSANSLRQKTSIPPGSYNPIFSYGIVWVTGIEKSVLTAVEASTGKQTLGHRTAVQLYKSSVFARAVLVNSARNEFFTRAAFPGNKH